MSSLSSILKSTNKGFLKDMLTGAGLTLATSGASLIAFNQLLNQFKANLGGLPSTVLSLAHIGGFDIFFSLLLGAYVTKFTLNAGKMTLSKK